MKIALDIMASFLGIAISFSAFGKIKRIPGAVQTLTSVGVKDEQINKLATLDILGSLGLLIGIWSKPIGIAAALGLALYFIGAQTAHIRAKDKLQNLFPATFLFLISAAVLILELKR